jgi:hypothetical protein
MKYGGTDTSVGDHEDMLWARIINFITLSMNSIYFATNYTNDASHLTRIYF